MNALNKASGLASHHVVFAGLALLGAAIVNRALSVLVRSSLEIDSYSSILFVLPVSFALVFTERRVIFANIRRSWALGSVLPLLLIGLAQTASRPPTPDQDRWLTVCISLFFLWSIAAFAFSYGADAFRRAIFPLALTLLIAPFPERVLNGAIAALQQGSAWATTWLFSIAGVPFTRLGLVFVLPKLDIEIAKECSGIRSSFVLLMCGLVLGHLFLKSGWTKTALALAVIPLSIAKNGVRIFTLSVLGMYVDPSFLTGRLHHNGGVLFFAFAFGALFGLAKLLRKFERPGLPAAGVTPAPVAAVKNGV